MNVIRETNKHLWCFCWYHPDKKTPNLAINKAGRWPGHYRCFCCGAKGKIPVEEVQRLSKTPAYNKKPSNVDWDKLQEAFALSDLTERKSLRLSKEWKVNSLGCYGVGWTGNAHSFPMRNEHKNIVGITRRFPNGKKYCVEGSHVGLFIPIGCYHPQVVVTEGLSDATVATELGYFGLGKFNAECDCKIIRKFLKIHLTSLNKCVIICEDKNKAGMMNRIRVQAELMRHGMTNIKVVSPEKDLRQYYLNFGRERAINLLRG